MKTNFYRLARTCIGILRRQPKPKQQQRLCGKYRQYKLQYHNYLGTISVKIQNRQLEKDSLHHRRPRRHYDAQHLRRQKPNHKIARKP